MSKEKTKFVKTYIGRGTKVEKMDIVRISIKVEDALKFKHEHEGVEYITMEVAKLKEKFYNKTHTVYVRHPEDK